MKKALINPDSLVKPVFPYSQAVRVEISDAVLIFISGQVASDKDGNLVGENDITRQTECVFENINEVLKANGASFSDVVKANIYVTNIAHHPAVTEVRKRYLADARPATTFVEVSKLAREGWLVEIEAIAITQT